MPEQLSQRDYWSGKVGQEWAAQTARIDTMLAPIAEALIAAGAFSAGEHVLDIGCGAGATSVEVAQRVGPGGSVLGVDLSPQMLAIARARAQQAGVAAEFREADAGADDLGRSFDAAISRFGVMFFEAPTAAFAHIRSAMRPGGRLTFMCWRPMPENIWATAPIKAIAPLLKTPLAPPDPDAPGPYAFADQSKVDRILRDSGWRDIVIAPWTGAISAGGGGTLAEAADFILRIGPCARLAAEQGLDPAAVRARLMDELAPFHGDAGVMMDAACWLVSARA